jgi:hypothetical protein
MNLEVDELFIKIVVLDTIYIFGVEKFLFKIV